ncbi:MAG: hypothetical protein D6729_09360 [Deltaproteobacteria bacterium]|nr:MAG: hypothetical protein D6729_09360 [Deltaproteobacteria bacterium]
MARRVCTTVLLSAVLSMPARAEVPLPGTQPEDLATPLQPSESCANCHGGFDEARVVEPWDTWAGSPMAHAARDPLFLASLTITEQDLPGAGDFCLRCHAPNGWLAGRSTPGDGRQLRGEDWEGIGCDFCHRLEEGTAQDPQAPYVGNAQYFVSNDPAKRGGLSNPAAEHATIDSDYHRSSMLCALCHDVTNPLLPQRDPATGASLGRNVALERTWTEWAQSDFPDEGIGCTDCHMGAYDGLTAGTAAAPARLGLHGHEFNGGNAWLPLALAEADPSLGAARAESLDHARAKALEALQEAATVEVLPPEQGRVGEPLRFEVRVTNLTGHKLPTGYPEGRRMWLQVVVRDGGGRELMHSGAYDTTTATLEEDPQLRLYEAKWGVSGGAPATESSFHFALVDALLTDTRIPPRGFRPSDETRPVGRSYEGPYDLAPYEVLPEQAGELTVEATLWYQTTTRAYVEWLVAENVSDSRGSDLRRIWEASGRAAPVAMASATATIPVVEAEETPPPAATGCACSSAAERRGGAAILLWVLALGRHVERGHRRRRA